MASPIVMERTPPRPRPPAQARDAALLAPVVYLVAALFLLFALVDIATLAVPFRPGDVAWRFGVLGAASNYLLTAFFGGALACWAAAWYIHPRTLRVLAVVSGLAALVLLVLVVEFGLDVLQLRGSVAELDRLAFRIGTLKALAKYLAIAAGGLVMGLTCWRIAQRLQHSG